MQDVTKDRDKYIGGSDIPIIMGMSSFKTRWELLQEKAGITRSDFDGNEYTEYGNVMEPKIRDYINRKNGLHFVEDKVIKGDLRYHADGIDMDDEIVLEVKTTGTIHDDINDYRKYLVQLLTGMKLNKCMHGLLAVYERPEDFDEELDPGRLKTYEVYIDDYNDLLNEIWEAIDLFRTDLAKLRENPFLTEEDLQPFELVALSDEVVRLENSLAAYKQIETEAKEVKARLKEAMKKHGIKKWTTNGGVKITLVPDGEGSTKKVFNDKAFKEDQPETYEKYLVDKMVKGKSGYVRITLPK